LQQHWNLIGSTCYDCNNRKSSLEDEISAVTMQPDVMGRHPSNDEVLSSESRRKGAGSISRVTRKPVAASTESVDFEVPRMPGLVGVTMQVSFVGPPVLDDNRASQLAWYQVQGFFYWITYNDDTSAGAHAPGSFLPLIVVRESDWGNPVMRSFQDLVAPWDHRVFGTGDYFAICIRRSPDPRPLWSWALEWNRTYRFVGFMGDVDAAAEHRAKLDRAEVYKYQTGRNSWLAIHEEQRLPEEDDHLFELSPEQLHESGSDSV